MPAYFITFEGVDGSGKSAQARRLRDYFIKNFIYKEDEVIHTFEPGGCDECRGVRELLLSGIIKDDIAKLLLFLGDRKIHTEKVIIPALKSGKAVICERYDDSTIAYQSVYGNFDYENLKKFVNSYNFVKPDITFMLEMRDINVALNRVNARGNVDDFESRADLMSKVSEIYKKIADDDKNSGFNRIVLIDACKSELEVALEIEKYIEKYIDKFINKHERVHSVE